MKPKTTIRGKNVDIIMDASEIYPGDPGMGTPVMIEAKIQGQTCYGTWNCVTQEGECDGLIVPKEMIDWIHAQTGTVEAWMVHYGA